MLEIIYINLMFITQYHQSDEVVIHNNNNLFSFSPYSTIYLQYAIINSFGCVIIDQLTDYVPWYVTTPFTLTDRNT